MKILRIKVDGLPLYNEPFDISFYAVQRVQENHLEALHKLFGNIYINTAISFVGINASGKTTALKVVSYASMILCATPLNAQFVPQILADNVLTTFDIYFYVNKKIYHLKSKILKNNSPDGSKIVNIISEQLWEKKVTSKISKTNLLLFDDKDSVRIRNNSDEYLSSDVSIMIAIQKQIADKAIFVDLAAFTNFNFFLPDGRDIPAEIISLLDPTIEKLSIGNLNGKEIIRLKFYGQKEIIIYDPTHLMMYLSSGTIKGVRVYSDAMMVLKKGGYLFIDEIENHFNRELVVSLLRLFMNKNTNHRGAVIVFSTHYSELLDEMIRNDSVFIKLAKNTRDFSHEMNWRY